MQKLKTPRAAEPNKPGCLKYGATVFCALGASIYLIIALTGYGLTDTSVRPLLFVLSGIMIAVIIIIWRPRSKKAAERQTLYEAPPSDEISEDLIPIQVPEVTVLNHLSHTFLTVERLGVRMEKSSPMRMSHTCVNPVGKRRANTTKTVLIRNFIAALRKTWL